jgi:copper chaperone NosL
MVSCSREKQKIDFGHDQCIFCKMIISDPKYGAELITEKGRINKYDAVECMINHLDKEKIEDDKLFAVAFDDPGLLYPVDSLTFVQNPSFRSPMGENIAAFRNDDSVGLEKMDWLELYRKVKPDSR